MLQNILPEELYKIISKEKLCNVYEIRLRRDKNLMVNITGVYKNFNIICPQDWVSETVLRASRFSIYTVNEQIKAGFIGVKGGIRIGLCGETVYDSDGIKTVKNISSLNIRLPHEIKGCSDIILRNCFDNRLNSTLIISKPGAGKTTLIRDICRNLTINNNNINVLILDERGEISGEAEGCFQFDTGNSDVLLNCKKDFGFSCGIRSMRPDVIVCDELKGKDDTQSIYEALSCGVCVVATVHADSIEEIAFKEGFKDIFSCKAFKRFVLLSDVPQVGTIKNIYDENIEVIYDYNKNTEMI